MGKYSNKRTQTAVQAKIAVVGLDLGKTWLQVCG